MSQTTTVKTTRETLDRIRPYAVFRESWDTAINNALDMLDELKSDSDQESHKNPFDEVKAEKSEFEKLIDIIKD
ncbi:MAG: hypothetical protein ABGW65_06845 [Marinoscillum sp.]|jgi:hypothetical protein